jgi:hypothetical protein
MGPYERPDHNAVGGAFPCYRKSDRIAEEDQQPLARSDHR